MNSKKFLGVMLSGILISSNISVPMADVVTEVTTTTIDSVVTTNSVETINLSEDIKNEDMKNAKISKEEAKEIATKKIKNFFGETVEDKEYSVSTQFEKNHMMSDSDNYIWAFNWDGNSRIESKSISVRVDSQTGEVIGANIYIHSFEQKEFSNIPSITKDKAKKTALDFIKKNYEYIYEEIDKKEGSGKYYGNQYSFSFPRQYNGINYSFNSINIQIDSNKNKVIGVNLNWENDIEFKDAKDVISKEEARELLENNLDFNLIYSYDMEKRYYDYSNAKLKVYYIKDYKNNQVLDANMGKMLDRNDLSESIKKDVTDEQRKKINNAHKDIEIKEEPISQDRAEEILENIKEEFFGEEGEINSLRFYESTGKYNRYNNHPVWSASIQYKNGMSTFSYGEAIVIDALTEEIISLRTNMYYGEPEKEFTPKVTWEKGYDMAIDSIIKYFPNEAKNIKTEASKNTIIGREGTQERYFNYYFQRIENGIEFNNQNINITIDSKEGKLAAIDKNWNEDIDIPSIEKILSKEEVKQKYLEDTELKLVYTKIPKKDDKEEYDMILSYILSVDEQEYYNPYIDAITGEKVEYRGFMSEKENSEFDKKLNRHWAKDEIQILADSNIVDVDTFKWDEEIPYIDAIKMITNVNTFGYYYENEFGNLKFTNIKEEDENYKYIVSAVRYGLIENKEEELNLDKTITREQMAKMIVTLLKYDKIADCDIYKEPFDDTDAIDKDLVGYVAIGKGLSIFKGSDNKFNPKQETTYTEFAVSLYRAMNSVK